MGAVIKLLRSWIYYALVQGHNVLRHFPGYHRLWHAVCEPPFEVTIGLHGKRVLLPSNYRYPLTIRWARNFNNPYVELIYRAYLEQQQRLTIFDVGAAVGDSFVLIDQNLGHCVERIFCVEGDAYFLKFLRTNLSNKGTIIPTLVSSQAGEISQLKRIHASTASAQGRETVACTTIDQITLEQNVPRLDVLKVDVDGFDGAVLTGACRSIVRFKPHVIFEFHPGLLQQTHNNPLEGFETLVGCNYKQFLWFDKFGNYVEHMDANSRNQVMHYYQKYKDSNDNSDIHFDVVAISPEKPIDPMTLVACAFAKTKPFPV